MKKLFTVFNLVFASALYAQVQFVPNSPSICMSTTSAGFTNISDINGVDTTGLQFFWNFGDGNNYVGYHAQHTYTFPGTFQVEVVADSSGFFKGSYSDFIEVKGVNFFSPWSGASFCPGTDVNFFIQTNYNIDSIYWNFGNGKDTLLVSNLFLNYAYPDTGQYVFQGIVYGDCIDTISGTIKIEINTPIFSIFANASSACAGDMVNFNSNIWGSTYAWTFPDGSTSSIANPSYAFDSIGVYPVILQLTDFCGGVGTDTLFFQVKDSIFPNATNAFVFPNNVCPNEMVSFSSFEVGTTYWNLDDGTIIIGNPSFNYTYADTGTYNIELIVMNGCGNSDTANYTVVVNYNPSNTPFAQITFKSNPWFSDTLKICPNLPVEFANFTWGDVQHSWSFGDGNVSAIKEPTHTYTSNGLYTVMYIATNNCLGVDTAYLYVLVDSTIAPNLSLMALPPSICPNEQVYFFVDGSSMEDYENYTFNIWFGDGDSVYNVPGNNPLLQPEVTAIHAYTTPGMYNYTFQAVNECGNTQDVNGVIMVSTSNPMPFFIVEADADSGMVCPGDLATFFAIGGVQAIWNWGDGKPNDTGNVVTHAFDTVGLYTPQVTITTGCGIDTTFQITFYTGGNSIPNAWFFNSGGFNQCANDSISFFPSDYEPSYQYFWDFGNGTTSSNPFPVITYDTAGFIPVELTVTNGCGSNQNLQFIQVTKIDIIPSSATINPTACNGSTGNIVGVQLNDPAFSMPYSYQWKDALGNIVGTQQNLFNKPSGNYTLQVTSNNGCPSAPVTFYIPESNAPSIPTYSGNTSVCKGGIVGPVTIHADSGAVITWYSNIALTDSIYGDSIWTFMLDSSLSYYVTQSVDGCESNALTISFTALPLYNVTKNISICAGDSIMLGGAYQNTPGMYYDTLLSVAGCDSIIETTLQIIAPIVTPVNVSICSGDSIMLGGSYQNSAGMYYDTLLSVAGCDSIIETTLQIIAPIVTPVNVSICSGDSIMLGGSYQNSAGMYYDTLQTIAGCDSIIETTLQIIAPVVTPVNVSICSGDSIMLGGSYQNTPGIYYDTLQTITGCDSIVMSTLSIQSTANAGIDTNITICHNATALDLNSMLHSSTTLGGNWFETTPSGGLTGSIFDPTAVNDSTTYMVYYEVGNSLCLEDTALWTINVVNCDTIIVRLTEQNNPLWIVYPNPSQGVVSLETNETSEGMFVRIIDLQGREIMRENITGYRTILELKNVTSQTYILQVFDKKGLVLKTIDLYIVK